MLHAAVGLLSGSPSDDAACGGGRALLHLLRYQRSARLPALSARDVHDVLVPLFLRKSGEAKEALMRPLRVAMADTAWMEAAWPYFESRGSAAKVQQVVHEMNGLEEMKAIATTGAPPQMRHSACPFGTRRIQTAWPLHPHAHTASSRLTAPEVSTAVSPPCVPFAGKAPDAMRPNAAPLADSLEAQHRVENLQPAKVAAFLAADLPPGGAVLDVGAGTGLFTFPLAAALPASQIVALEVRSDAIRAMRARARREGAANVTVMRMGEGAAPSLPGGAKASLVLLCDVLELVPEHAREVTLPRHFRDTSATPPAPAAHPAATAGQHRDASAPLPAIRRDSSAPSALCSHPEASSQSSARGQRATRSSSTCRPRAVRDDPR